MEFRSEEFHCQEDTQCELSEDTALATFTGENFALQERPLKREFRQEEVRRLRQLWDEGVASGPGTLGDIETVKKEARRRQAVPERGSRE
jgi:hypothetical protein